MRRRLYEIIFEAHTPAGRLFDVLLFVAILVSVVAVMLESVPAIAARHGPALRATEWVLTAAFTVEYVLRLVSCESPRRYASSFFGVVDLLAVLPTYVSVLVPGSQSLAVIRILRLVRVFRVLKLVHFLGEARMMQVALRGSLPKITVFLVTVVCLVVVVGSLMHLIEGPDNPGFASIPEAVYWAIVTVTTVGYGDVAPVSTWGKLLACVLMIAGYAIIAVPTGIVAAEFVRRPYKPVRREVCPRCLAEGHEEDAGFCRLCGAELNPPERQEPA